jgi:hypothetical protein
MAAAVGNWSRGIFLSLDAFRFWTLFQGLLRRTQINESFHECLLARCASRKHSKRGQLELPLAGEVPTGELQPMS